MSVFLKRQKVRKRREVKKVMHRLERFLMIGGLLLFGLVLLYGFNQLVFFSPSFAIREIVVEGEGKRLPSDEVAEISGVHVGDNLFWTDVSAVHRRLETHPWIRVVSVRRRPPHTLWLYVEEEEPAAVLSHHGLFFVNHHGEIFKKLEAIDEKNYPVFTGIVEEKKEKGHRVLPLLSSEDQQRIRKAFSLLSSFDHSSLFPGEEIAEIHFHPVKGFSLVTLKQPITVVLGHHDLEKRLQQLEYFREAIRSQPGKIQYIVMHDQQRIVVKYTT